MAVIELASLSKWYGEVIGLNNVTAQIGAGMTGLVGPNGAGKSTMMGLIMGQLHPSKGRISVLGQNPWNNPSILSQIGYCPEGDPFWFNMSGYRFVSMLARASGLEGLELNNSVDEALELTGMSEHARRSIGGYSKGMRQRIKLAQALVHKPRLLILDEPFTGADPVGRHELGKLFRSLALQGVDILISSHVLHEVEALTKQILMIDHGRIVAQGDLHEVRRTLSNRPHAIRVRLDNPRGLAQRLAAKEFVTGIKIEEVQTGDSGGLVVETRMPDAVYDEIGEFARSDNNGDPPVCVREIAAADENLEAVFGYLTQRGD